MMLNMVAPGADRTAKTQLRLQEAGPSLESGRVPTVACAAARTSSAGRRPDLGGRRAISGRRPADARRGAARGCARDADDRPTGRFARVARPARLGHEWFPGDCGSVREGCESDRGDRRGSALSARIESVGTEPCPRRSTLGQGGRASVRPAWKQLVGDEGDGGDVRPGPAIRARRSDAGPAGRQPSIRPPSGRARPPAVEGSLPAVPSTRAPTPAWTSCRGQHQRLSASRASPHGRRGTHRDPV